MTEQQEEKLRNALATMANEDRIEERNRELERENEELRCELKRVRDDLDAIFSTIDRFLKAQAPAISLTNSLLACGERK